MIAENVEEEKQYNWANGFDYNDRRMESNNVFIPGGTPPSELEFQTNRSYLFEVNEARSQIKVIDPKYITQFADKYEAIINNE